MTDEAMIRIEYMREVYDETKSLHRLGKFQAESGLTSLIDGFPDNGDHMERNAGAFTTRRFNFQV